MTLQQLRYVVEIAREGSMSRAARNLLISQPSLSSSVAALEKDLSIDIFERTSRGVKLSPDGEQFIRYAAALLEQADNLVAHFTSSGQIKTVFSVSSQHYAFVSDAFCELVAENKDPHMSFSLREGQTLGIVEDVYSHRSEIGVLYTTVGTERYMNKLFESRGLEFTHVRDVAPHVFVRPDHPLLSKSSVSVEDLSSYPFVFYEQGEGSASLAEELWVLNPKTSYSVQDRATMENLIGKTDAYTIGTGYIIPGITGVTMASLPLRDGETMQIGIVHKKGARLSAYADSFIGKMRASLRKWAK